MALHFTPLLAALISILALGTAQTGGWQPPGIEPSTASLATVVAARNRSSGAESSARQRVERYSIVTPDAHLSADALLRGADVRFRTTVDGAVYESGRSAGRRWRRTPAGVVRMLDADVQGDPLDRWPRSPFSFDAAACTVAGETADAARAWILACNAPHDLPRWFFIERNRGDIVREVVREGVHVVTFDFSHFRTEGSVRRPYAWHVDGWSGPADITVDAAAAQAIEAAATAIPPSAERLFQAPARSPVALPARFHGNEVVVDTVVDGRLGRFVLDTGTTQLIVGAAFARRAGLHAVLGHVLAGRMAVGAAMLSAAPMLAVDLGGFGIDGLLGYDFFVGHVVHVDYRAERVELLPRDGFEPPDRASAIAADFSEGMPLVAGRLGPAELRRVALDTGSQPLVVTRSFLDSTALAPAELGLHDAARRSVERYLEGPVAVQRAAAADFGFGPMRVEGVRADLELPARSDTLQLPFDAIVGTEIMARFEWWFDAGGGRVWVRPRTP